MITFKIAEHNADPIPANSKGSATAQEALTQVWRSQECSCKELLQTSLKPGPEFIANKNGFVNTILRAYNQHHNLVLRPDDIWLAILAQLNLYVNAHAEDLRSKFVAHEGKKNLSINAVGTRYTVDFGKFAQMFGDLLRENIVDPSLHDWILPEYSTSTPNDTVVCSVMMMSTLKAYFSYSISLMCGIPSITLLGEKHDYETILGKLSKLEEFGVEPAAFARLLRPIVTEFVLAFDVVAKGETPNPSPFWSRVCHYHSGGSGPTYLSGWIGAFCCWNKDGKWQGPPLDKMLEPLSQDDQSDRFFGPPPPLVFQGLRYPVIDTDAIPNGFCEVDVKLNDNGEEFDCLMVSGHMGMASSASSGKDMDSLQPAADWFMFTKGDAPKETERFW